MDALRLRKDTVPGLEKARQTRRMLQLSRQRASRSSLLQTLRTFLTADSFMYGPLLESPPPPSPPPPPVALSSDSEPHTPEREQEKDGSLEDGATLDPAYGKEGDASSEKHGNGHGYGDTPRRYQGSRSSKTTLSYQRIARAERAVPPLAATPTSTAPVTRDVPLSSL